MSSEFAHQMKHAAVQAVGDYRAFHLGVIAEYDPQLNHVRVELLTQRDSADIAEISDWMPLGSIWAGDQVGIQYYPKKGEPVLVCILERDERVYACAVMFYLSPMRAPATALPDIDQIGGDNKLKPGELLIRHSRGSIIRMLENGDIFMQAVGDFDVNALKDMNFTAAGSIFFKAQNQFKAEAQKRMDLISHENDINIRADVGNIAIYAQNSISEQAGRNIFIQAETELDLIGGQLTKTDGLALEAHQPVQTFGYEGVTTNLTMFATLLQACGAQRATLTGATVDIGSDGQVPQRAGQINLIANRGLNEGSLGFRPYNSINTRVDGPLGQTNLTSEQIIINAQPSSGLVPNSVLKLQGNDIQMGMRSDEITIPNLVGAPATVSIGGQTVRISSGIRDIGSPDTPSGQLLLRSALMNTNVITMTQIATGTANMVSGGVTRISSGSALILGNSTTTLNLSDGRGGTYNVPMQETLTGYAQSATNFTGLDFNVDNQHITFGALSALTTINMFASGNIFIDGSTMQIGSWGSHYSTSLLQVAAGDVKVGPTGGTFLKLLTEAAAGVFNAHVHPLPTGGNSSPPTTSMGSGEETLHVTAV